MALVLCRGIQNLFFQRLEPGSVIKAAEVYVTLHHAGAFGLDYVGGGAKRTPLGDKLSEMTGVTAHKKAAGKLPLNHVPDSNWVLGLRSGF